MNNTIDDLCINAIRMLSMNAIDKAKSGHPGMALGAAPIIHTLYSRHLNASVKNPNWINRDRFVLSAGHASSMLYATLHIAGFAIKMEDLKQFRQIGSLTPGHPESHLTPGIDATTGPLGQGIAMGAGLAVARTYTSNQFMLDNQEIFDNYTYVLCGDGCLQEGIALETLNFVGSNQTEKYIILYDSNDIQLDGPVMECHKENSKAKYEAMGLYYDLVVDGTNVNQIDEAIKRAKNQNKPAIIEIKTTIGFGSELAGTSAVHGAPLGVERTKKLAQVLNWEYEDFFVPKEVYEYYENTFQARSREKEISKTLLLENFRKLSTKNNDLYNQFFNATNIVINSNGELKPTPTRNIAGNAIIAVQNQNKFIIGGSGDVCSATKIKGINGNFSLENKEGRNILFGVREHAMGAITNGITMYGGLKGFSSTFFAFSDYMKPALKMAALMEVPSVFIYSHDTIAVGEDGPTHQPIEHLVMLRSIPNFNVLRPCDEKELNQAFEIAFNSKSTPSAILTTRQELTQYENANCDVSKGAYIFKKEEAELKFIIIASGSEVMLAVETLNLLGDFKKHVRIVSMPSTYLFDKQEAHYQQAVLPKEINSVAVEMANPLSWYKYSRNVYGIETFGMSGPFKEVLDHYGFTPTKFKKYLEQII